MTDRWSVAFVGRTQELETIQKHLMEWGMRRLIFIWGEGGIGKTRLLSEVEQRFSGIEIAKIPPIIDFDDDRYKLPANVGFTLARQIDPEAFEPYFEAFRNLRLAEARWGLPTAPAVTRKALAVDRLFVESMNQVSQTQRIVIRVDTTDALQDTLSLKYLFDLASNLNNTLLLAAGRNAGRIYQQYGKALGADAIEMPLQPFISLESHKYLDLKQKLLKVTLDTEWMDKLFILAGGVPVVIDLSIEWAKNHRQLPWMQGLSLVELEQMAQAARNDPVIQKQLADLQEQFKKELVMPVAQLSSEFDQLLFTLAKVYPLDQDGVMEMLDLDQKEAEELLERAIQSVAIKVLPDGRIKLHDEIERLVNLYVWPAIDSEKTWEQRDSRKAIYYLRQRSNAILQEIRQIKKQELQLLDSPDPVQIIQMYSERYDKEAEFWALRIEQLRRQLEIDIQEGYTLFHQNLDLISTENAGMYVRSTLLSTIEPYANWSSPAADIKGRHLPQEWQLAILRDLANESVYLGMYRRAAEIYEILLDKTPRNTEEYATVLNGQANLLVRAGKLQDALHCNERVIQLSEQASWTNLLIKGKIETGWIHRLRGYLGQAQQYYAEALELARQHNNQDSIAHIYSQMAYVHALQHRGSAMDEVKRAIAMRQRQGNQFRLGICYNIAGEVYLEAEQSEDALTFFELSWSIFSRENIESKNEQAQALEWQSKSRSGRGFVYWQLASGKKGKEDPEFRQHCLSNALDDLRWAADNATPFDSPAILNRLGEVYFLRDEYDKTAEVWQRSITEAQQVGDAFTEFHSLSDLARLAFHYPLAKFPDWQEFERYYMRDYRRRYQDVYFEILNGLFYTYLGHLALKNEQIQDAVNLYERGLAMLSETGTFVSFNLPGQLEFIETEIIPHISASTVRELGSRLQKIWDKGKKDIVALGYFDEWSCWKGNARLGVDNE